MSSGVWKKVNVCVGVAVLLCAANLPRLLQAQVIDRTREYNVKAVFLYSFGRYVTWPEEGFAATGDRFVIAVYGETPIDAALGRIAQKRTINGRKMVVRQITSPENVGDCQILFVAASTTDEDRAALMKAVEGSHVLLVGESTQFAEVGGCIGFYLSGETVRFAINVEAARREGLTLNAKLLSLGRRIDGST
jgi:hypothetical protein